MLDAFVILACFGMISGAFIYFCKLESKRMKRYHDLVERFVSAHEALAGRK